MTNSGSVNSKKSMGCPGRLFGDALWEGGVGRDEDAAGDERRASSGEACGPSTICSARMWHAAAITRGSYRTQSGVRKLRSERGVGQHAEQVSSEAH